MLREPLGGFAVVQFRGNGFVAAGDGIRLIQTVMSLDYRLNMDREGRDAVSPMALQGDAPFT